MRMWGLTTTLVLACSAVGFAQNDLQERCPIGNTFCDRMAGAAEIAQVRTGIGLVGGNPVLGASSTLGMRLRALPRLTMAARVTGVQLDVPDVTSPTASGDVGNLATSINLDAAVGVFSGLSLLPTVGGFGSIDVLASYGWLSLPDEYVQDNISSWAVGLRIGILRESFTAPGIAVSGMFRSIEGQTFGSFFGPSNTAGTYFIVRDHKVWSGRATVGKRILMLGAVAGIGYDKFTGIGEIQNGSTFNVESTDFDNSRTTLFANLSWTMLLLNIVAEGGVQRGGSDNTNYGSLAVRLAL
jgi:hypothetical protein